MLSHFIRADLVPIRGCPEPLGLATSKTWVKCFLCSCRKYGGWLHALLSLGENMKVFILWCGGYLQALEIRGPSHGWEVVSMMKQMSSTVKTPQIGKFLYAQSVLGLNPILKRDKEKLFNGCTGSKKSPLMFPDLSIFALSCQPFFPPSLYSKLHIKSKVRILQWRNLTAIQSKADSSVHLSLDMKSANYQQAICMHEEF